MTKHALVFESDPLVAEQIVKHVHKAGFTVIRNNCASDSLSTFEREQPDLVILDIMSATMDGINVGQQIRRKNARVPILFLATQSDQLENLLEQNIVAADYLIKPLSATTLVTRIHALVSRVNALNKTNPAKPKNHTLVFDTIKINPVQRTAETPNGIINLTRRESDLLLLLASKPGRAFKRSRLLEVVWQHNRKGCEHTINTHISRLRKKIEMDPTQPKYIQSVWGVGYKFKA